MDGTRAFIFLFVTAIFMASASAQDSSAQESTTQKPFEDIWSRDLKESTRNCYGRLPNILDGEDMKFAEQMAHNTYIKYMDQVLYFRLMDVLLSRTGGQNKSLTDVRCLFESPCIISRGSWSGICTLEFCTGDKVDIGAMLRRDGLMETAVDRGKITDVITAVSAPTFTDRKSFVVLVTCMYDGSLVFYVLSNRPALSAYSRHQIAEHLKNSGFKDYFRVTTTYMSSSCKNTI